MNKNIGLSTEEAEKRLAAEGENRLAEKKRTGALKIFAGQFRDTMVMILMVATVISAVMGEFWDALTIIVIVVLNAVLGFVQEYRTEKTLETLKKMAAPTCDVYRDGKIVNLPASALVRGDVVSLEAGAKVPADCKLLEAMVMECDESILTGESVPVSKTVGHNNGNELNQKTVCYMGTPVTKGHGIAEVINTGRTTQMGLVSDLLSDIEEEKTPLQKRLSGLGKAIGVACIVICLVVSLAGVLRGYAVFDMLLTGISLAVAAIPEGLPATVTISLALAVRRIYKQKALVNKLHSVETLGCTDVICTDKTGTLTQNRMSVSALYSNGGFLPVSTPKSQAEKMLYLCAGVCNNAVHQSGKEYLGDPTETALLAAADKVGVRYDGYRRLSEVPFDSGSRFMEVWARADGGKKQGFVKGAVDVVLKKCDRVLEGEREVALTSSKREQIFSAVDDMADRALRTLGFAYNDGNGYVFLGIAGISDPLRPEVKSAVRKCKRAGVRVVMLTGDHKNTAREIAKQAGISTKDGKVVTGAELKNMSDESLREVAKSVNVFARVSPTDKLRIVRGLKSIGATVAMTGDGVNDAPAVKEAAIGVAMGITGTDVTKEAAQIVLLDDNFATLVSAIEEGRTIYDNIRKFVRYMLSCNIGEVVTMLFAMLLGMPVVLIPIQILLINLVTDGLPAIALGMEPSTKGIMEMPPRKADESIFAGGLALKILARGLAIGILTLMSFVIVFNSADLSQARTAALATLALSQLIFVFECKDDSKGIFNANYLGNPHLLIAVAVSLAIILLLMLTTTLSPVFQTAPLDTKGIVTVVAMSAAMPVISGVLKLFR